MGAIFLKKRAPAATYPQVRGFQKYGAFFFRKEQHFVNASKATGVSLERKSGMQAILHLPNCEANAQGPNMLDQNHGIWSEMGPYGSV